MNELYALVQAGLQDIKTMQTLVERICHQTLECSYFIQQYAQNEKFRKSTRICCLGTREKRIYILVQGTRFLKNTFSETDKRVYSTRR